MVAKGKKITDPVSKLFGSPSRVRLLRLFLFNPAQSFSAQEAAGRARIPEQEARRETAALTEAGLLRQSRRKPQARFILNDEFQNLAALQEMLLYSPLQGNDIYNRLRSAGAIRLVVLTGAFVGQFDGRLDLLIVGERLSARRLAAAMRTLEAETGMTAHFATLSTADFTYRMGISDHFLRDIFDYPHRIAFDRLNIGLT